MDGDVDLAFPALESRTLKRDLRFRKDWKLFKRSSTEKRFYLILSDVVSFTLCVVLGYFLMLQAKVVFGSDYPALELRTALELYPILFGLPMLLIILMSEYNGLYSRFRPFWDEYGQFLKIVMVIGGLTTAYLFFSKIYLSRAWISATWLCVLFIVPVGRTIAKHWMMQRGIWFTPTVVVGSGDNALESALALESNILMGFKVIALLDLNLKKSESDPIIKPTKTIQDRFTGKERSYSVLPYTEKTKSLLVSKYTPYFVLALDSEDYIQHRETVDHLASSHYSLSVIPPLRGLPLLGTEISPIFRHEVLHLRIRNNLENRSSRIIKRVFDQIVSGLLLIIFSPLFLYLIIRIRMDGGPAFFSQERVGKKGKPFKCYKFRSMQMDAETILNNLLESDEKLRNEWKLDQKLKDDPRITKIGNFIRKTSIDELPQIWNVFKGEMSLVGPRPIRDNEKIKYRDHISYYLETPPGISGLWQISGRNDLDYDTRVDLDTWYVRNWSLGMDIVILIKTFSVVFYRKGAY